LLPWRCGPDVVTVTVVLLWLPLEAGMLLRRLGAPRLVTDGDIKGGRHVSGVYDLVVVQGAP